MAGAAAQVKRVTLELGGRAPAHRLPTATERAATTAPTGVFDNAGQVLCLSRILVQRSVYDRFMELLSRTQHCRQGTPDHAPPR